jgi:dihydropteroate synthase
VKDKSFSQKNTINVQGKILDISSPIVMGIINITPDSFYAGSRHHSMAEIVERAGKMLDEGASILDVGGYSSRPGAKDISIQEEIERVIGPIQEIHRQYPQAVISIDTFRHSVAKKAIESGAAMINDISGGELDKEMKFLVADMKVPYIIMHMRGTPQTMKTLTEYKNVYISVMDHFQKKTAELHKLGVGDIIVDPGFGFAKTVAQNYELLRNLAYFKALELPILVGISRKSMIFKTLGIQPEEALNGTTVLNTIALEKGAQILRVHDVKQAMEAVKLYNKTNC